MQRASRCAECSTPIPLNAKGEPRRVCDDPVCRAAALRRAQAIAQEARRRREARRKTRRCSCCDRPYRRTVEHFYVKMRTPDGEVAELDHMCKGCRKAAMRERYASDTRRRAQALAAAKRQRERVNARMDSDPDFREAYLQRRREWDRASRRRRAQAKPDANALTGGPRLPGVPLGETLKGVADREGIGFEDLAARIGVPARTMRAWRNGERDAELVAADHVLQRLDLLWWDVWEPEAHREVAVIFEGEQAAA